MSQMNLTPSYNGPVKSDSWGRGVFLIWHHSDPCTEDQSGFFGNRNTLYLWMIHLSPSRSFLIKHWDSWWSGNQCFSCFFCGSLVFVKSLIKHRRSSNVEPLPCMTPAYENDPDVVVQSWATKTNQMFRFYLLFSVNSADSGW